MTAFIQNQVLDTVTCCKCACLFAMPESLKKRRLEDHQNFWCPNGHQQHFTGQNSEADRLRADLARKQEILDAERARSARMEQQRDEVARAHARMRKRIQNGVCPCCNRTFQNLLRHMQTEHADQPAVRTLRQAFGLTQAQLGEEIGVYGWHVSQAERGKPVPGYAAQAIQGWVDRQVATKTA